MSKILIYKTRELLLNFFLKNELNYKTRSIITNKNNLQFIKKLTMNNKKDDSIFHKYKPATDVPEGLFVGAADRFNGVTIESNKEDTKINLFPQKLQKSLEYWIGIKRRGIWFKVYTENSEWVPLLTKEGFEFHHAKDGYVMLCKWLPQNESPNIPLYCHTMLGVGGLVINWRNEILVVTDRNAMIPNSWKLPGGYVEPKENLVDAAIREVREETNIETKFVSLISLRHSHRSSFNSSDLYIIIALEPIGTSMELKKCEREIERVAWMPVQDYLVNPNVHETNRLFVKSYLDNKKMGIKIDCENKVHPFLKVHYNLYHVKQSIEDKKENHKQKKF